MGAKFRFGYCRGEQTAAERGLRERVAELHGCIYLYADIPGLGPQGWFEGPNSGEPFNSSLQSRVIAAAERALGGADEVDE